jgi:hypothetical protein
MRKKFMRELVARNLPLRPPAGFDVAPVTETHLQTLPETVGRYLRFMGVVGRPRDWSFRLGLVGRFRRSPDEAWMKCEAWQYNTRLAPARIFYIQIRLFGILPVLGRDTYAAGRGRMLIRLFDLVTVADGRGEPYDIGELVTYLNDAILIAPSMLLIPEVRWSDVDANSFDVALTDNGITVSAHVSVDERGAPVDFETSDRFYSDPKDATKATRCRWRTPVEGWQRADSRLLPMGGKAVWRLPDVDFAYADFTFDPTTVAFNVGPGE